MVRERHVLGVDGGNTKTIGVVARLDGTLVGVGRAGCSDIYAAPSVEEALDEVERAARAALGSAGARGPELAACAFSMAGADWPDDSAFLGNALEARGFGRPLVVVNDAVGALRAGSKGGNGVAVVCGTGAAIGARAPNGRQWHSGWWQEPQGSRQLAEKTLRAIYRADLGIAPPTALTGRVLEIFGATTVESVLKSVTARDHRRSVDDAALTSILLEEAARGDRTACRLVQEHGASLGDYALAAARRVGLGDTEYDLVLSGGVFRNPGNLLADAIVARVRAGCGQVRPVIPPWEPAVGAVLLALEAAHAPLDSLVMSNIRHSLPPELSVPASYLLH